MKAVASDSRQEAPFEPGLDGLDLIILREIHHRVSNTFAQMAASLRREFAPYNDMKIRGAIDRHERYIIAQGSLYRCLIAETGESVAVQVFFRRLSEALGKAILEPIDAHWNLACDYGVLDARRCECLSLILTELVTNAAKHAFSYQPRPIVSIKLARHPGWWSCMVSDNGSGLPEEAMIGQGSKIVEGLARSIRGSIALRTGPSGTEVTVFMPD